MNKPTSLKHTERTLYIALCSVMLLFLGSFGLSSLAACNGPAYVVQIAPMLPKGYYQCIETTPDDLMAAYFAPYSRPWLAEMQYNNQPFVLKNIEVSQGMIENRVTGQLWIGKLICYPITPDELKHLRLGQRIDVVGLNRGVSKEWRSSVYMTGCYFLPAGTLALPAGEAPIFTAGY